MSVISAPPSLGGCEPLGALEEVGELGEEVGGAGGGRAQHPAPHHQHHQALQHLG